MADYWIVKHGHIENCIIAESAELAQELTLADEVIERTESTLYDLGWVKNEDLNKWYNPKGPYPSWSLDENYDWQPPVEKPDGDYEWDEDNEEWVAIEGDS